MAENIKASYCVNHTGSEGAIDYSVIIRTLGKAGDKYRELLKSIDRLKPAPKEVIVVLPEGYEKPSDSLGYEIYYYCHKGMVEQRLYGINKCRTKYALIVDDDLRFPSDFVQKLYEPLNGGKYKISIAPLIQFLPQTQKQIIASALMGGAVPTVFHKDRYNTVLRTTGYSYNRRIKQTKQKYCLTQSAPWTCFFAEIQALRKLHFEDEAWLDRNGYSSKDDTAMFYKAWLRGNKTVVVCDAEYEHLDAKTSTSGISTRVAYASGFNTVVFWHRFLYSQEKSCVLRLWCKICLHYFFLANHIVLILKSLSNENNKEALAANRKGVHDGKDWIQSEEYKNIKPVC